MWSSFLLNLFFLILAQGKKESKHSFHVALLAYLPFSAKFFVTLQQQMLFHSPQEILKL